MKTQDMVVGNEYLMRTWLPPVKKANTLPLPFNRQPWGTSKLAGIGFPGCWVTRRVRVIERDGQHLLIEVDKWKCNRDMETLKCTWERTVEKVKVYARELRCLDD